MTSKFLKPLQKLLHLKVTWRKSESPYPRMLHFLQTITPTLGPHHAHRALIPEGIWLEMATCRHLLAVFVSESSGSGNGSKKIA